VSHQVLSNQQFSGYAETREEASADNPQQQAKNPEPEETPGAEDG